MPEGIFDNETISAVLGGVSGGVVSWLVTWRAHKTNQVFACFQAADIVLDELDCAARAYWRKSGQIPLEESTIKALLERLDLRLEAFLRTKKKSSIEAKARALLDDLTDDVSGGDFETARRRREVLRVGRIKSKCSELRDLLFG